ncbi:NEAT domain-containing protein [Levilactobacillus enshiensis]|uniref:NEAT domain-containing protein n=1 Tax=Levilactobacillus enshiensis TaxID=2590213 RepID=UPI00117BA76B|nr:NEAT domain-containing protein [Levilactobacillus enshiensis]
MNWVKRLLQLLGIMIGGILVVNWGQSMTAKAAVSGNGIYQVPVKIIKEKTNATSDANQFFGKQAVVRVNGNHYTVLLTSNGAQYIKSMKVNNQTVTLVKKIDSQAIYQFNLTKQTSPLTTAFQLTTPVGAMNEKACLTLAWSAAEKLSSQTATTELLSQATTLAQAATTTSSQSVATSSSSTSVKPSSATKTSSSTKSSSTAVTKTTAQNKYWKYQVLKSDQMSLSDANKYYTGIARVTPADGGYRVTLMVSYAKSLKLGSEAVVPKSIDGQKIVDSQVTYSEMGKNYTMVYGFNIKRTSDLTRSLIPGKIHVTVPIMHINETFPVRFQFAASGSKTQQQAAAVAALPKKTTTQRAAEPAAMATARDTHKTAKTAKQQLPATGERQSSAALVGVVGLLAGILLIRGGQRHV